MLTWIEDRLLMLDEYSALLYLLAQEAVVFIQRTS
jgi:hypothetical protein